ncbi:L-serine dehydratase [Aspergillus venezuelensis]
MGSISMTATMPLPPTTTTTLTHPESHIREQPIHQADTPTYKTPWIRTPLIESRSLSTLAGCRILLKLENTQPSGSFKSRAMGAQILSHLYNPTNQGKRIHFFASSGGNAGLAAVCAAKTLGFPCTVVVPVQTKSLMVDKLVKAGARKVVKFGETFAEAGEYMRDVVMQEPEEDQDEEEGGEEVVKIALHPFDNESIWEGNSTLIDELAEQVPALTAGEEWNGYENMVLPVDAMVCSVGGGGLLNGLVMGLERRRRQVQQQMKKTKTLSQARPTHLVAVETRGTDSLAAAVKHGELVSLPKITSQATSLGAIRVSERTFQYAMNPPEGVKVHSTVFSDADAARGVLRLVDEERVLVELACGVCVEAAVGDAARDQRDAKVSRKRKRVVDEGYGDDRLSAGENESEGETELSGLVGKNQFQSRLKELVPDLGPESRVVIVVCGGSNVTIDAAVEWRVMLKDGWGNEQ